MELAYARNDDTEPDARPDAGAAPERHRPSLRIVPDTPSSPLPPLPRRPSRRAVIRAHVWGVPISSPTSPADRVEARDPIDRRIAEAIRLLGRR